MDNIADKSFKYDIQKLDSTSDEYIFVKEFYNVTIEERCRKDFCINKLKDMNFQIHKVIENRAIKVIEAKSNNLMLFHGTK